MVAVLFTNTDRYAGWCNLVYVPKFLELSSWIKSGNYVMVQSEKVASIARLKEVFKKADQTVIEGIEA